MRQLQRNRGGGRTSRRVGFTLVELLVVIAIIGVLVVLLPPLERARGAARTAITQAEDAELARVASVTVGLADELERIFREQRSLLEPVATKRRAMDVRAVQRNLQRLLAAEQQLDRQVLPALRRIHPRLGEEDRALARELRTHLRTLRVDIRKDIHLKRFLLEGRQPDERP
jgi:prepilin-type N-terminal cleavage/methylation domain-containing protein